MPYRLALIFSCILCFALNAHGTEQTMNAIPLPFLENIELDGKYADWDAVEIQVSAFSEDACPPLDAQRCRSELRLAWNHAGLLACIRIESNAPWVESENMRTAYRNDSVELFLRQGSSWSKLVQAVVAPGFATDQDKARVFMWDYRGRGNWDGFQPAADAVSQASDNGGCLEVLIPWQQLKLEGQAGLEVEFRININKVIPGLGRRQFTWRRSDGDFFQKLILSKKQTAYHRSHAASIDSSDPWRVGIAVVAEAEAAGKDVVVSQGEQALFNASLQQQDNRSICSLWLDRQLLDYSGPPLQITLDGQTLVQSNIDDPVPDLERTLEAVFIGRWRNRSAQADNLRPQLPRVVSKGPLPQAAFKDPQLARLTGVKTLETVWYDNDYNVVSNAEKTGRYAAAITATLHDGRQFHHYHSAMLLDDSMLTDIAAHIGVSAEGHSKMRAAIDVALQAESGLVDDVAVALHQQSDYPERDQRAWIHGLRKKNGTEIVYPYNKRMPSGYDDDSKKQWPAIIYLHGSNGRLPSQQEPIDKRIAEVINRDLLGWSANKDTPFARYALLSNGGWQPEAVLDTVDRILKEDRIDPERIIVMGFSMGGMGTWRCIVDYPERWAAAVPIGGRGALKHLVHRIKDKPIWIFNGDVDRTTTLEDARSIYDALKAIGGKVQLTVLPGIGHGGSQNGTFETAGLWEWLEQQRRVE